METMRLKHRSQTDLLFTKPLELVRKHCLPYAVQQSYEQMEFSVYYLAEFVHLPCAAETRVRAAAPQVTSTVLVLIRFN